MIAIIGLLVVGGAGAFFAAQKGLIQIPGITPKNPKPTLYAGDKGPDAKPPEDANTTESTQAPEEEQTTKPQPETKPAAPTTDAKLGQNKLAELWNGMDVDSVVKVTADWSDADLAPIFAVMDGDKVAALFQRMAETDPKRASRLMKAVREEASKIEPPTKTDVR